MKLEVKATSSFPFFSFAFVPTSYNQLDRIDQFDKRSVERDATAPPYRRYRESVYRHALDRAKEWRGSLADGAIETPRARLYDFYGEAMRDCVVSGLTRELWDLTFLRGARLIRKSDIRDGVSQSDAGAIRERHMETINSLWFEIVLKEIFDTAFWGISLLRFVFDANGKVLTVVPINRKNINPFAKYYFSYPIATNSNNPPVPTKVPYLISDPQANNFIEILNNLDINNFGILEQLTFSVLAKRNSEILWEINNRNNTHVIPALKIDNFKSLTDEQKDLWRERMNNLPNVKSVIFGKADDTIEFLKPTTAFNHQALQEHINHVDNQIKALIFSFIQNSERNVSAQEARLSGNLLLSKARRVQQFISKFVNEVIFPYLSARSGYYAGITRYVYEMVPIPEDELLFSDNNQRPNNAL